jgi:uncharacterized Zn finger protein
MPSFYDLVKKEEDEPADVSISCEECNSQKTTVTRKGSKFSAYCQDCGFVTVLVFEWME